MVLGMTGAVVVATNSKNFHNSHNNSIDSNSSDTILAKVARTVNLNCLRPCEGFTVPLATL